jgi:hypothetical protein
MMEPDHNAKSRAWSWRHAVGKSGLPPTTRLVLHTLGLKMDATGGSCFPPISELVELTGLDKKTVLRHLELAEEKGWIEVSQHGFRGQRWKRNEYIARWPGRDLAGSAASLDNDEGGGMIPPPFDDDDSNEGGGVVPPPSATKVVELVPEGGGTGSQKVVAPRHQDKILPANSPKNSPAAGAGEGSLNKADRKKIEHAFTLWFATWDKGDIDFAKNAWFALSDEERAECIAATPEIVRWTKLSERKAAAVFLKERQWRDILAKMPPESERTVLHNAYSKAWSARRLFELLAPAAEPPVPPTGFQQMQLRKGGAEADAIKRERRLAYGWPVVTNIHRRAEMAEGITVAPWLVRLSEGFVSVPRSSALAAAWRALHERHGWPQMPERVEWLYFPAGEPEEAMQEFSEALARERGNDDAA